MASYQYLGLDTIVTEKYQEPEIELDLTGGTDAYTGLDQFGRVIDQVWKNYSTGGSPLDEFKYGYNSAGDVQWKQNVAADNAELQFDESYTYNDLGELTGAQRGPLTSDGHGGEVVNGGTTIYSAAPDGLGPTSDNDANQTAGCTYDNAGNLTFRRHKHVYLRRLNRLVQVSNSSTTVNYGYHGEDRLVERESGNTTDYYFYAGSQVVETRETTSGQNAASAPVQYQYVWSAQSDAPVLRDTISSSTGQPIPADRIYYLTDANDNVTAITNNAGQVLERDVYSPFGQVTYYDCSSGTWVPVTTSPNHNTILFAGQNLDPATRLYYDHARWYSPGSGTSQGGTFLTRDPMGYAAGDANLYRYCGNNPVSATDPTGLVAVAPQNAGNVTGPGTAGRQRAITSPGTASRFSCPTARLFRARKATTGPPSASPWATSAPRRTRSVVHIVGSAGPAEIDAPGFWESLIPVWGPARASSNDYQHGRWIWGTLNYVLAVTDVLLVRSIITSTVKIIGKSAGVAAGGKTITYAIKEAPSGQLHHAITKRVFYVLEKHPVLRGRYDAVATEDSFLGRLTRQLIGATKLGTSHLTSKLRTG